MFSRLLRTALTIGILCLGVAGATAPGAGAAGQIESALTTTSASQAGGHPNLTISAGLANPGAPETAKSLVVEEPAGLSAYMYSVPRCSLGRPRAMDARPTPRSASRPPAPGRRADPTFLFGTAPIYAVAAAGSGGYGRLAFTIPTLAFTQSLHRRRSAAGDDYGLRLTMPEPAGRGAAEEPRPDTSGGFRPIPPMTRRGSRWAPKAAPELPDAGCNTEPTASGRR